MQSLFQSMAHANPCEGSRPVLAFTLQRLRTLHEVAALSAFRCMNMYIVHMSEASLHELRHLV